MRAVLCAGAPASHDGLACASPAGGEASYFGSDQPRITAELVLPWSAFGVDGAPEARRVALEVAVTAWHRSRWVSLSGATPDKGLADPAGWETVSLAPGRPGN
jgi:hypothetical protein